METAITKLFNIQYPILLSGMTGVSTPELVAAVSNAGGLGILATGGLNDHQTHHAIVSIREMTNKPFGANVPLMLPGAEKKAGILIDEKVPVVNYSLGKGDRLSSAVHSYGGKIVATVVTHKHALAAQRDGADALLVTGHEAAAHGGDVTSLVLVPSIADVVDIPVIAAGGFADGRGLAAALALGASGIAMGTRFMNTLESPVHQKTKQASIEKSVHDTIYSPKIDGMSCRAMKSNGVDRLINDPIPMIRALFTSRDATNAFGFPWFKMLLVILAAGWTKSAQLARMANSYKPIQNSLIKGDVEDGVLLLGQATGMVNDTPAVSDLIERIVAEAIQTSNQTCQLLKP